MNCLEKTDAIGQALHIDSIIVRCDCNRLGVNLYRVVRFNSKKMTINRLIKNDKEKILISRMSTDGKKEIQCSIDPDTVINVTRNLIACGYTFQKTYYSN